MTTGEITGHITNIEVTGSERHNVIDMNGYSKVIETKRGKTIITIELTHDSAQIPLDSMMKKFVIAPVVETSPVVIVSPAVFHSGEAGTW